MIEPEPWKRKEKPGKIFTMEEVEKWKRKAEKKEWKERAKLRSKKRMEMDARQEKLQQNIWFRKVENWLENKLLSFNQNKQVLANMMKEDREEIERAEIERVIHEIDPKKIDENNARLTRKKEEKAKEERVVIDIFDTLNTTKEKYPKKTDIMTALSKSEELKRKRRRRPVQRNKMRYRGRLSWQGSPARA